MSLIKLGYCRVSSAHQADGLSLGSQASALLREGILPDNIYSESESAFRNKRKARKEFQAFIDKGLDLAAQGHQVELITVFGDRWARDVAKLLETVERLEKDGVVCRALDYGRLSVITADDRLKLQIFASLYENYSHKLSERVSASVAARIERGIPIGAVPFGYQWRADKTGFEPHPENWAIARFAVDMMLSGHHSTYAISQQVKKRFGKNWNPASIGFWFRLETLLGAVCYRKQGRIVWGCHEPLVSLSEFEALRTQLDRNRGRANKKAMGKSCRLYAISSGDCRCAWCGSRLGSSRSGAYRYFMCRKCDEWEFSARADIVEAAVIEALCAKAKELAEAVWSDDEQTVSPRLGELKQQELELEALLNKHELPGVRRELERIQMEIRGLMKHEEGAEELRAKREELAELLSNPDEWMEFSEVDRRGFYRDLLDHVVCQGREIVAVVLQPF